MKRRKMGEKMINEEEKDGRKDDKRREQDLEKVRLMNRRRIGERMINKEEKDGRNEEQ